MKKLWMMTVCMTAALFATDVQAFDKVVYGEDDRLDIYEVANPLYLELARSTAAMIPNGKISSTADNTYRVTGSTLSQRGICKDAKFANQTTAANCSGFLVGDDLLVTAGHCIRSTGDCRSNKWVFNYAQDSADQASTITGDDVYGCKEIVERSLDRYTKNDYALIRLDRKVKGRTPLTVRTEGMAKKGDNLVVIGHPTGLPSKVADGAWIRTNNENSVYFVANLDTFGGNSGSAVFNTETGVVEGILVRGEADYAYDSVDKCRRPKVCDDNACRGEDVTRITEIKALMNLAK